MGNFNPELGKKIDSTKGIGSPANRIRNEEIKNFCEKEKLFLMNTFFEKHEQRTCISLDDLTTTS